MRSLSLLVLVSVSSLPTSVSAQTWSQYVDRDEFFSVNLPGEPEVREVPYRSEYGATFPSKVYTVQYGENSYSITVVDYTDARQIYLELPDKTDEASTQWLWLYDQLGSVAYAARRFRDRGGDLTYDNWHHIDFVEGHQMHITNPDRSRTYVGLYMHHNRLYILEATVPETALPQGLFQQSLSFLDEDGMRLRYELTPERSRSLLRRTPL